MKQLFTILLLLCAASMAAQKVDIKKISIQKIGATDYYVSTDTLGKEITIRLVPVQDQVSLLDAQLAQVEAEIAGYDELLNQVEQQRKDARLRKKEIEKLKISLQTAKLGRPAPAPAPMPVKNKQR